MIELQQGQLVGELEVVRTIGRGATSRVYLVRERATRLSFALKVLERLTLDLRHRFEREAGALTALHHPNILRCHGFLHVAQSPAMLVEYVSGGDLATWIGRGGSSTGLNQCLAMFHGALMGVAHAHSMGFVHRDLKPRNVLLSGRRHRPRIADFGLVKLLPTYQFHDHLTFSGAVMGTAGYMAPEQAGNAKRVDHRADVWSLGCLLYELVCGRPAFPGNSLHETLRRSLARDFVRPCELVDGLPPEIDEVVGRCLQPDPALRPASCAELAAALGMGDVPAGTCAAPTGPRPPRDGPSDPTIDSGAWVSPPVPTAGPSVLKPERLGRVETRRSPGRAEPDDDG